MIELSGVDGSDTKDDRTEVVVGSEPLDNATMRQRRVVVPRIMEQADKVGRVPLDDSTVS